MAHLWARCSKVVAFEKDTFKQLWQNGLSISLFVPVRVSSIGPCSYNKARHGVVVGMKLVRSILNFLWDLLYFCSGEGTWRLRAHEIIVLEGTLASLPNDSQNLLRAKLNQVIFVQRSHKQISLPRFYSSPYVPDQSSVVSGDLSNGLLSVQLDVEGQKQSAHVEFFQGRVWSVQFKNPSKFYAGKVVNVLGVKAGNPRFMHAAAIDRAEHGP